MAHVLVGLAAVGAFFTVVVLASWGIISADKRDERAHEAALDLIESRRD